MAQAHVTLPATLLSGSNVKRFGWRQKATARQVFTKRSLDDGRQQGWHFLPPTNTSSTASTSSGMVMVARLIHGPGYQQTSRHFSAPLIWTLHRNMW
jgi:hypothetical protein